MQSIKQYNVHRAAMHIVGVILLTGSFSAYSDLQPVLADIPTYSYSLWPYLPDLGNSFDPDAEPIELGVKFRSDVDGQVTAIRFYRSVPIDSGYKVNVWSATGELLGTGVAIEGQGPTPGWQTVIVYPPAAIKAGEIYTASYYASKGNYSIKDNFWTDVNVENGPLHILRQGVYSSDGIFLRPCAQVTDSNCERNGVFKYGLGGGFPTEGYLASNYWIDIVFKTQVPPPYFPYKGLIPGN
jgi:hypothetical protein